MGEDSTDTTEIGLKTQADGVPEIDRELRAPSPPMEMTRERNLWEFRPEVPYPV